MLLGAAVASGCGTETGSAAETRAATGTFSVPLVSETGGHRYRVQGYLYVYGPTWTSFDINGDVERVSTSLPAGDYTAYLYGLTLSRDDGSGNFVPVEAQLTSSSSIPFRIFNGTTTTISIQFETDGHRVTVGAGNLDVDLDVEEVAGICTLLGDDCTSETWCAPPELTGRALACIGAGSKSEGAPCTSPLECAANTSCFDFGMGPVCTRLCLSSDFGELCDSGGTCTEQGTEYGVCAPAVP
jgi:hypothetical protein